MYESGLKNLANLPPNPLLPKNLAGANLGKEPRGIEPFLQPQYALVG
jgi:hypothetical protein